MTRERTILVLEDEPLLCKILVLSLTSLGAERYRVMAAADGRAGLVLARQHRPDLVVTDLDMPVMDGREFVLQLRSELGASAPPVILMSGRPDLYDVARQLGVAGALLKPFREHLLRAAVDRMF